jgi:hypothetical protein
VIKSFLSVVGGCVFNIIKNTLEECPEMMPAVHIFEWKVLFLESIGYQI